MSKFKKGDIVRFKTEVRVLPCLVVGAGTVGKIVAPCDFGYLIRVPINVIGNPHKYVDVTAYGMDLDLETRPPYNVRWKEV